jgi:hypothetical protein
MKGCPGERVLKAFSKKGLKSARKSASNSRESKFVAGFCFIGFSKDR